MNLFEKPTTLFQQKVNDLVKGKNTNDHTNKAIETLIKLQWVKKFNSDSEKANNLIELQNYLGLEKFVELINFSGGKTLVIPTKEDFKETILLALCYYYRNSENKTWEEIKSILKDSEFPTMRYKSKLKKLQTFLESLMTSVIGTLNLSSLEESSENKSIEQEEREEEEELDQ